MDGKDIQKAQQTAQVAQAAIAMGPGGWTAIAAGCGCLLIVILFGGMVALGVFAINNEEGMTGGTPRTTNIEDGRQDISKEEWEGIYREAGRALNMPWELGVAILYSESAGGTNFGGCSYFAPSPTRGWVLNNEQVRNEGDRTTFASIVGELNYPNNRPVSCNAGGANGDQNGGAMGYMQVMPPEWSGAARRVSAAGIGTTPLNPWNAQDAAYVGSFIIRNKAGLESISQPFPTNSADIKLAISRYLGGNDTTRTYVTKTYARFREIQSVGRIP